MPRTQRLIDSRPSETESPAPDPAKPAFEMLPDERKSTRVFPSSARETCFTSCVCSHCGRNGFMLTTRVPVQNFTFLFSQPKVSQSHCVISQEPFLYSVCAQARSVGCLACSSQSRRSASRTVAPVGGTLPRCATFSRPQTLRGRMCVCTGNSREFPTSKETQSMPIPLWRGNCHLDDVCVSKIQ